MNDRLNRAASASGPETTSASPDHIKDTGLVFASAQAQARALAAGEISAIALLEVVLARIAKFNPALNAVIFLDEAGARAAALAADAALQRGDRRPLLGVPISVKESFDVAGWPTTVGNPVFRDNLAAQDAPTVAALRAAGAVLIGKTNVPLALADLQSFNDIYGLTRNPWDLSRTPGGSSGGSAAALAAGFSALELGTDIGGSIRIPAHFTGVFGHKPSHGLIALKGTGVPQGRHASRDLVVAGPLARSAADLELALDLLLNLDPIENKAWRVHLPAPRATQLSDFRVLLLDHWPDTRLTVTERDVVARVAENLRAVGATLLTPDDLLKGVPQTHLPDLRAAHALYRSLLGASLSNPPPLDDTAEARLAALRPEDNSADAAWLRSFSLSHREWLAEHEARLALRAQWERVFSQVDVILTPVAPLSAFAHNTEANRDARTFTVHYADGVGSSGGNESIGNDTAASVYFRDLFHWAGLPVLPGLPATSFPVGFDAQRLPIGAQVVGPYLEDRTPLAFARLYETAFGGFVSPAGY